MAEHLEKIFATEKDKYVRRCIYFYIFSVIILGDESHLVPNFLWIMIGHLDKKRVK
jgi:hypothetical protein